MLSGLIKKIKQKLLKNSPLSSLLPRPKRPFYHKILSKKSPQISFLPSNPLKINVPWPFDTSLLALPPNQIQSFFRTPRELPFASLNTNNFEKYDHTQFYFSFWHSNSETLWEHPPSPECMFQMLPLRSTLAYVTISHYWKQLVQSPPFLPSALKGRCKCSSRQTAPETFRKAQWLL